MTPRIWICLLGMAASACAPAEDTGGSGPDLGSPAAVAAPVAGPPVDPALPPGDTPILRAARGKDPDTRCMLLPLSLQQAPFSPVDLNGDAWVDRLMLLPASCATRACTWRVYRQCPGGGYQSLIELIALEVTVIEGRQPDGWRALRARVPAPSNQPQEWLLHYEAGRYRRVLED